MSSAHSGALDSAAAIRRRSIRRSVEEYGLHPDVRALPARLSRRELSERRGRVDEQLGDAALEVASLSDIAERAGCALLLTTADGVVVRRLNRGGLGPALDEGSRWAEAVVGNNAVGTALVEQRAVSLHGKDHWLEILHPYSCTAVPLWDGHQRLVGMLDLTTAASDSAKAPFLRDALEQRALAVHTALFAAAFREHCLIELAATSLRATERSRALVAVSSDGDVAGMTRPASRLLAAGALKATTPLGRLLGGRLASQLRNLRHAAAGARREAGRWSLRVAREGHAPKRPPRRPSKPPPLDLEALAGRDATMQRHRRALGRLIDTDLPIMIGGETGTGKDALAKAIHRASRRSAHAFVAVNCASVPESILDSELFGYAPGTFTGGLREGKPGKMEAAHRGTLFLDEIGDMPLPLQGRLLRVLAEREVTRLGAIAPVPVDFQLITATHRNLDHLVAEGQFREDLLYRLRGAALRLPALRERTDRDELVHELSPPGTTFAPGVLEQLLAYPWPGNIRQLKQVLTFASACSDSGRITLGDLPPEVRQAESESPAPFRTERRKSERHLLLAARRRRIGTCRVRPRHSASGVPRCIARCASSASSARSAKRRVFLGSSIRPAPDAHAGCPKTEPRARRRWLNTGTPRAGRPSLPPLRDWHDA
ncbi:MAG: sigma-54-dependent Fis family transcriptional regulator [Myxococcota bacterium]